MVRAYDENGNVVDLVEWENQIRADAIEEIKELAHEDVTTGNMIISLADVEKLKGNS